MSTFIGSPAKSITTRGARAGQSLIEAMVALTIIISSVSSAMVLVQSSITASRIGGSQVVAANLAREGIEVVRGLRDSNWLSGAGFQTGLVNGAMKTARPFLNIAAGTWSLVFGNQMLGDPSTVLSMTTGGVFLNADTPPAGALASPYSRLLTLNYICRLNSDGTERIETGAAATCVPSTETFVGLAAVSSVQWTGVGGVPRVTSVEERLYDWR